MLETQHCEREVVSVVDDDDELRTALCALLTAHGFETMTYASAEAFLAAPAPDGPSCVLLDVNLQGIGGFDLHRRLKLRKFTLPVILMSGFADVPMSVRAMKAGAVDFLAKPFRSEAVIAAVRDAVEIDRVRRAERVVLTGLRERHESLTPRETEVMSLVAAGLMNKQVAGRLGLSEIMVKIHRGNVMRKMDAQSLADLVRMAARLGTIAAVSRFSRPLERSVPATDGDERRLAGRAAR